MSDGAAGSDVLRLLTGRRRHPALLPAIYSPHLNLIEALWRQITYHEPPVRTHTEPAALLAAVIQALERHAVDPSFAPKNVRTCAERGTNSTSPRAVTTSAQISA